MPAVTNDLLKGQWLSWGEHLFFKASLGRKKKETFRDIFVKHGHSPNSARLTHSVTVTALWLRTHPLTPHHFSSRRWAVPAEAVGTRPGLQQYRQMCGKWQLHPDHHRLPVWENHGELRQALADTETVQLSQKVHSGEPGGLQVRYGWPLMSQNRQTFPQTHSQQFVSLGLKSTIFLILPQVYV